MESNEYDPCEWCQCTDEECKICAGYSEEVAEIIEDLIKRQNDNP